LFGGGTDFSDYYKVHGGCTISFALNKYIYISAHPIVESRDIFLKYSSTERVSIASQIIHPGFRETLMHFEAESIDLNVVSDVPAGTGLGSSSSFLVGLIKLMGKIKNQDLSKESIASLACDIEISRLRAPIGKQDQYSSAFGGFNKIEYKPDNSVNVENIDRKYHRIVNHMALVRIGGTRKANELLEKQLQSKTRIDSLQKIHKIAKSFSYEDLNSPELIGEMLLDSWAAKREISESVSTSYIDNVLKECLKLGAYGGKLLGAGNAGYLLVIGPDDFPSRLRQATKYLVHDLGVDVDGAMLVYEHD
jgi:D-glycero-alpha-D-manno-heptose-7-phosphate kinase